MRRRQFLVAAAGTLAADRILGQQAGALLAPTPPMGWIS
jgi:alpha-galactosidase